MQTVSIILNTSDISAIATPENRVEGLVRAFKSCAAQVYQYYELIIVDDGSPIDLRNILKPTLSNNDEHKLFTTMRIINMPHCGNIGFLRNLGAIYAKGDYLLFMTDDGELDPLYLQIATNTIEKEEKNIDIVFCGCTEVKENQKIIHRLPTDIDKHLWIQLKNNIAQPLFSGMVMAKRQDVLNKAWSLSITDPYPTNALVSKLFMYMIRPISLPDNLYTHYTNVNNSNRHRILSQQVTGMNTYA